MNTRSRWSIFSKPSNTKKLLFKVGHLLQVFSFVEKIASINSELFALSNAPTFIQKFHRTLERFPCEFDYISPSDKNDVYF